ncbi:hypothetical protein MUY21_05740 [Aliiroseovarius sp. S2029]|uniref:AbiU2 domain-containing protein n=1 Tax=Aliiroseovarius sp. S2029 TaxID=2936988 RepID=UPI0020BF9791|nr:hypothetical protein [Aliiroseovarius sp. S2029]MCK8483534.1 hypothetical protein [Aliiroseovarius sp. S2029]
MSKISLSEEQSEILKNVCEAVYTMDIAWRSFLYFFGSSQERARFLSETSPAVSVLLGNLLWDATLTRIRALTDQPKRRGNTNLSVGCLVDFCEPNDRKAYQSKFEMLQRNCEGSRRFASKHIAHFDLRTKLDPTTVTITRGQTTDAIDGIWAFLFSFHADVLDTHICRDVVRPLPDERGFLELLYLGKQSQAARLEEFKQRFLAHKDFNSALPGPRDDLPDWLRSNVDQNAD